MRRANLLDAAREIWAGQGWAAVTMRGVCARARLTDRYFYESFPDRDALLVAVAQEVRAEAVSNVLAAVQSYVDESPLARLRAILTAVVGFVADNPGTAQIFFGDHGGSEVLEEVRRDAINAVVEMFLDLTRPLLLPGVEEKELRVVLLLGIGGFVEVISSWRTGEIDVTADELVDLLLRAGRRIGQDFTVLTEAHDAR